jgi:hypothetical protein
VRCDTFKPSSNPRPPFYCPLRDYDGIQATQKFNHLSYLLRILPSVTAIKMDDYGGGDDEMRDFGETEYAHTHHDSAIRALC